MSELAIDVQNLTVDYRTKRRKLVRAVTDLSFQVKRGEVVGFLGPNGAGKSTTLRTLMGFQRAKEGKARIFDCNAGTVEAKRFVGFLPEVALYYPFLTPTEILTMYGRLQGIAPNPLKDEIKWLLDRVGLSEKATTLCRNLSKGQLQRVGIAQSLLGSPKLLILDEVTSGLDPVGRRDLRRLLQEKQQNGTTIFFSSHELTEVEMLCDRIILINQGRLLEERNIEELRGSLTKLYLRFVPPPSNLDDLTADWTVTGGEVFAYFRDKDEQLEVIQRVQKSGGKILDLGMTESSLEDYFVETIHRRAA